MSGREKKDRWSGPVLRFEGGLKCGFPFLDLFPFALYFKKGQKERAGSRFVLPFPLHFSLLVLLPFRQHLLPLVRTCPVGSSTKT
jgi:hypothetical protein